MNTCPVAVRDIGLDQWFNLLLVPFLGKRVLREERARAPLAFIVSQGVDPKELLDNADIELWFTETVPVLCSYIEENDTRKPCETFRAGLDVCLRRLEALYGSEKQFEKLGQLLLVELSQHYLYSTVF